MIIEEEEPDLMAQIEECKAREADVTGSNQTDSQVRRAWTNRINFEELLSEGEENAARTKISLDMSSSTASLERRSDMAPQNVQLSDFTIVI